MRVLVTGHNGYIGCALVPILVRAGHEVVGLDNCLFEYCTLGPDVETVATIRKDVREVERADVEGFDAIIHLAGISNDPLGDLNPDCTYDINHRASVRLAKLAKQAGVERFLFSSSCSNYGAAGSDSILTEEAAFNPVTPYGHSKVLVEKEVSQLADSNFTPVFLRNATAYGFSARLRGDLVLNTGSVRTRSRASGVSPVPVSVIVISTCGPGCASPSKLMQSGAVNSTARTVSFTVPWVAMASRALSRRWPRMSRSDPLSTDTAGSPSGAETCS